MGRDNRIAIVADCGDGASIACRPGREHTVFDDACCEHSTAGRGDDVAQRIHCHAQLVVPLAAAHQGASAPAVWAGPAVTAMPLPWRR
jgi:hypothetical protein